MKRILSIITVATMILIGLSAAVSAKDTVSSSAIPDELIVRQFKQHDASLAISVEAVLYKIKRNRPLTLVDVRRRQAFERLHIPGSINIPLYAVKTKTYLKPVHVVLVNEGFSYIELQSECRGLGERGFQAFILDGGLPAWKRRGGPLVGDLLALDDMKVVAPRVFYRQKDYETTLVVDISPTRSDLSRQLMPYAQHIPVLDGTGGGMQALRKLIGKHKPLSSIILFDETGEAYERAEKIFKRMVLDIFYLQGGLAGYKRYLNDLMSSWQPRQNRMKTVSNCKPCGKEPEEE